jgi:TrmH family RNA methyltransferase
MITSHHNPQLKEIRRLQRKRDGRFVAEGEDLAAAADAAGWPALLTLEAGVDVTPEALDKVSALGSGTRVLGVYEERWAAEAQPLCVALWGVRDPGNVGTVLRSAHAFGAACVALGPDCADPFGPKAVRASMGAIFRVPVVRVPSVDDLPRPLVALDATGPQRLGPGAATLLVGAEREGLPDDVLAAADRVERIEIQGDSLNAAMAATVAMYEANRVTDE